MMQSSSQSICKREPFRKGLSNEVSLTRSICGNEPYSHLKLLGESPKTNGKVEFTEEETQNR